MFQGQTWMALGGFSALDPLECALNQGRTYGTSGTAYIKGQRLSIDSKPVTDIKTADELENIYLKHFEFLWMRAFNGQLGAYGNMNDFCPCPLLSTVIEGCIEKG